MTAASLLTEPAKSHGSGEEVLIAWLLKEEFQRDIGTFLQ